MRFQRYSMINEEEEEDDDEKNKKKKDGDIASSHF